MLDSVAATVSVTSVDPEWVLVTAGAWELVSGTVITVAADDPAGTGDAPEEADDAPEGAGDAPEDAPEEADGEFIVAGPAGTPEAGPGPVTGGLVH